MFLRRWRQRRHARGVARRMMLARRLGLGLYVQDWSFGAGPEGSAEASAALTSWCRQVLGRCRRPYGIAHFELVVACSYRDGSPVQSIRLRDLEPADVYGDGDLTRRLDTFLISLPPADGPMLHVSAAIFSWGDAAHAALAHAS